MRAHERPPPTRWTRRGGDRLESRHRARDGASPRSGRGVGRHHGQVGGGDREAAREHSHRRRRDRGRGRDGARGAGRRAPRGRGQGDGRCHRRAVRASRHPHQQCRRAVVAADPPDAAEALRPDVGDQRPRRVPLRVLRPSPHGRTPLGPHHQLLTADHHAAQPGARRVHDHQDGHDPARDRHRRGARGRRDRVQLAVAGRPSSRAWPASTGASQTAASGARRRFSATR